MAGRKRYDVVHCGDCGRELKTTNHCSDIHLCSACWQDRKREHRGAKVTMKLGDYILKLKGNKRIEHLDKNYTITGKHNLTPSEASHLKYKGKI